MPIGHGPPAAPVADSLDSPPPRDFAFTLASRRFAVGSLEYRSTVGTWTPTGLGPTCMIEGQQQQGTKSLHKPTTYTLQMCQWLRGPCCRPYATTGRLRSSCTGRTWPPGRHEPHPHRPHRPQSILQRMALNQLHREITTKGIFRTMARSDRNLYLRSTMLGFQHRC